MKKETMLDYLDKQIDKQLSEFDTAIDWDTRNHTIELMVRLFAENNAGETIDDSEGISSQEEIIEFEDGILFFNTEKGKQEPNPEDFLAVIPFDGKKGISKAVIDSVLVYLNDVLTDGLDDLLEFLNNPDKEFFELIWDEEEYKNVLKQAGTDLEIYLPYPSY
ncbi:DUF3013 family protein [Enterococcus sp. BWB1-3]|uniref:DUF3013 family protein n=1 Tax=unclassified Enterococcus TaxID=2608891 RepID=UPI0019209F74|nr:MULTISPECIES: DUF3013 family protein [unclassified Enterococcus]MBL1228098.1 DUF3013 family protein [Enterococcus sp. BWB1-3]MCB5951923.1 DUF3013 family protein [Enterococcus sp. BWT-B8]